MKAHLVEATGPEAREVSEFVATIAEGFAEMTRDEDYVMGASQRQTANAGLGGSIVFGRNEPAVRHFRRTHAAKLDLAPPVLVDRIDGTSAVPPGARPNTR